MRLKALLIYISLGLFSPTLVSACGGGHAENARTWSQEELDELEAKWGTDVSHSIFIVFIYIYKLSFV